MATVEGGCIRCGGELTPELSQSTKDGFRCAPICPPPVVRFYREVLCDNHKRITPGSARCAKPPCSERHYTIDGQQMIDGKPIVSVTTVTKEIGDTFGQGAWWGQGIGVAGTLALIQSASPEGVELLPTDRVVDELKKHKLTTNHVRDTAAQRGTDVHALAEHWVQSKEVPQGDGHEESLRNFIETEKVRPLEAETLVGSRKFAYAGTHDLIARFPRLDSIGLIDYKSKTKPLKGKASAYEQHHLQLRGYEDARQEMGYEATEFQAVVNLYPDGEYAIVQGRATSEQWQAAIAAYRSLTDLRTSIKEIAA
jgi:hypothetical protein